MYTIYSINMHIATTHIVVIIVCTVSIAWLAIY